MCRSVFLLLTVVLILFLYIFLLQCMASASLPIPIHTGANIALTPPNALECHSVHSIESVVHPREGNYRNQCVVYINVTSKSECTRPIHGVLHPPKRN